MEIQEKIVMLHVTCLHGHYSCDLGLTKFTLIENRISSNTMVYMLLNDDYKILNQSIFHCELPSVEFSLYFLGVVSHSELLSVGYN